MWPSLHYVAIKYGRKETKAPPLVYFICIINIIWTVFSTLSSPFREFVPFPWHFLWFGFYVNLQSRWINFGFFVVFSESNQETKPSGKKPPKKPNRNFGRYLQVYPRPIKVFPQNQLQIATNTLNFQWKKAETIYLNPF